MTLQGLLNGDEKCGGFRDPTLGTGATTCRRIGGSPPGHWAGGGDGVVPPTSVRKFGVVSTSDDRDLLSLGGFTEVAPRRTLGRPCHLSGAEGQRQLPNPRIDDIDGFTRAPRTGPLPRLRSCQHRIECCPGRGPGGEGSEPHGGTG